MSYVTAAHDGAAGERSALTLDVEQRLGDFSLSASLALPASGVTALFGPSGSGKTSLLRMIAGLDAPHRGAIRLGDETLVDTARGVRVPPHRRHLGVVFQEPRLFPHYRVRGNLAYGMRGAGRERFDAVVELLGIGALLERFPATLSGGEARRVAIGRALLSEPRLLLMDEPLTGLDGARKQELLDYIARLAGDIDIPIVYVSHDPDELTAIADHLVLLEQGRVVADGPLDALLQRFELTERLGGFDAATLVMATVEEHDPHYALSRLRLADGQRLTLPAVDAAPGTRLRLRIPVREVALALDEPGVISYRNRLRATVEEIGPSRPGQAAVELRLRLGEKGADEQRLRARLTRKSLDEMGLEPGMSVIALVRSVAFDTRRP
ncbi:Sulfate/thiosulfate import ATP-binding protein CysA [Halomonas sp. THAF12]|uniref:molybdenum ABC transporter ATP-binding protein n=1 Tax=Halomonas sp. THAF12 TaxID=2587849 RepID=UPI001267A81C|nr:molybdenum ABC transporter ATP-binding protein [Halomonas sp. THAF12]QFT83686.1 Sulfate/thiosulfate import ATP-binding protein CysA [Halomonas sp. THAF12]